MTGNWMVEYFLLKITEGESEEQFFLSIYFHYFDKVHYISRDQVPRWQNPIFYDRRFLKNVKKC